MDFHPLNEPRLIIHLTGEVEIGLSDGVQRIPSSSDGPFQRITLYTGVGVSLDGRVQDLVGQDNLEQFVSREPTLEEAYISILN